MRTATRAGWRGWLVLVATACGPSGAGAGGDAGESGSSGSGAGTTAAASMSSTSAATTAASTGDASSSSGEGDIETGASSETTATESSSSSSSSSSSGASSETGDAPPCEAVIDLQACFQAGCVFGVYDDTGCHAPFDDAQCAAHGDAQTCLEAFCDWDPLRTACSANVTGDCAQIEDPLLCLYSECIPVDGSCYEPGTAPCDALTGTIECVMNLCNWDDLALLCS